jgi:hypothetical protein
MLYDNESLSGIAGGTVSKLGLTPINGTQRTGNYLQYKNVGTAVDPLATLRASIVVDPDAAAATFQTQLATLATFYNTNFTRTTLISPMDNVGGVGVKIKFNPNYYINGLKTDVLTANPWLEQTLGWTDILGAAGTYNFQN